MATIYKGSTLVEGPMVSTWKVGVGGQTRRTFTGTSDRITAKAIELQAEGYETEITTGPKYSLVATINIDLVVGGDTNVEPEPIPQWELTPINLEQNILESGRTYFKSIPTPVKAAIENKLKNPQKESLFVVPPEYLGDSEMINKAVRIYTIKNTGIDGRRINSISLKRTIVVSTNYNPSWSLLNNEKVLSTTKVQSLYNVPVVLRVLMPSSRSDTEIVEFGKNSYPSSVSLDFYYGWLEGRPTYQTIGTNRISISQEWIYGRWLTGDEGLYDTLI